MNDAVVTIEDCVFENFIRDDPGIIANLYGTNKLYISNCIFRNNLQSFGLINTVDRNGNADMEVTIINSHFYNNQGKAIYNKGTVNVINCTFDNCHDLNGACIENYGILNIDNCTFTNNVASNNGGVIANLNNSTEANMNIKNSRFINNTSPLDGAAIFNRDSYLNIDNCTFTNNYANNDVAICNDGYGLLNISNSRFESNRSTKKSGAINATNLINCNFTNNYVENSGGFIYNNASLNVTGSNFINNIVITYGIIYNDANLTVNYCNFTSNHADGGTIYNTAKASVDYCNFTDNSMQFSGAAIYSYDDYSTDKTSLNVSNCNFINNKADISGAAIESWYSYLNVVNCNFTENEANEGGAIYVHNSSMNIAGCNFDSNIGNYGGAIFARNDGSLNIANCTFNENTANYGGAIYLLYNSLNIADCIGGVDQNIYTEGIDLASGDLVILDNSTLIYSVGDLVSISADFYSGGLVVVNANPTIIIGDDEFTNMVDCGNGTYIKNITMTSEGVKTVSGTVLTVSDLDVVNATLLVVSYPTDSFSALDYLIRYYNVETYNLTTNYTYYEDYDKAFIEGIVLNNNITINGNGFTLDGADGARIFNIAEGVAVTLNDINFVNGSADYGSAIINYGNLTINNCNGDETQTIHNACDDAIINNATLVILDNSEKGIVIGENINITAELTASGLYVSGADVNFTLNNTNLTAVDCGNGTYWNKVTIKFTGLKEVSGDVNNIIELDVFNGNILSYPIDSFYALNKTLNSASPGETITLNMNYKYYNDYDSAFSRGINLNNDLNINGNGYSVDGNESATIFNIINSTCVVNFDNLTLMNAVSSAIFSRDGSVYIGDNNRFVNNYAPYTGGAIYAWKDVVVGNNNTFTNNVAESWDGSAIRSSNGVVTIGENNTFSNNYGDNIIRAPHIIVSKSIFENPFGNIEGDNSISTEDCYWGTNNPNFDDLIYGKYAPNAYVLLIPSYDGTTLTLIFINSTGDDLEPFMDYKVNITVNGVYLDTLTITDNIASLTTDLNNGDIVKAISVLTGREIATLTINAPVVELSVDNVTYGDNVTVNINVVEDDVPVTGDVTVKLNGIEEVYNLTNGQVSVNFSDLAAGEYTVYVTYNGNENYTIARNNSKFKVNKATTNIEVNTTPTSYESQGTIIISVTGNGNNATGNVTVYINGQEYNKALVDGSCSITISKFSLAPGKYTVGVGYPGNENFTDAKGSGVLEILKGNSIINILVNDITIGDNATVNVSVTGSMVEVPLTGTVNITVNNITKTATLDNGMASVYFTDLAVGEYLVTVNYSGNDNYNNASHSTTFKVKLPLILDVPAVEMYYRNGSGVEATLTLDDQPLVGETINLNINGVNYTRVTDSNGKVLLRLGLSPGKYVATVNYNGTYGATCETCNVTVLPTISGNDTTLYWRKGTAYTVKVVDKQGKIVTNQKVKFNINGVFYEKTTDSKGIATLRIGLSPGKYIVTAENLANGEKTSNNITVKSIMESNDTTLYWRNGTSYNVKVLDDQERPIAGVTVTFNINGVYYTKSTDANGIATLRIGLSPGEYIVTAEYNGFMQSNKITVKPILIGKDITLHYRDGTAYKVQALNGQGNPAVGVTVTFNINGVYYTRTTDANGIASLRIGLNPYNYYIITAEYKGFMTSNKIVVKP